jgi:antitoxin HicB
MNTVDEYIKLPYTIELHPEKDGTWFVAIKELPGCMSVGDTPEEALIMIRDAQKAWIETALEENITIPEPRHEEEYSGNFRLRLSKSLHHRLAEEAEREDVSLNTYCSTALAQALGERTVFEKTESFSELADGMKRLFEFFRSSPLSNRPLEDQFAQCMKEELSGYMQEFRMGNHEGALDGLTFLYKAVKRFGKNSPFLDTISEIMVHMRNALKELSDRTQTSIEVQEPVTRNYFSWQQQAIISSSQLIQTKQMANPKADRLK